MKYKILTNRFSEWSYGDIADIDFEAARVALEKGEIVPFKESEAEFVCEECQKVCKNKLGLSAHMRSHKKK